MAYLNLLDLSVQVQLFASDGPARIIRFLYVTLSNSPTPYPSLAIFSMPISFVGNEKGTCATVS